ncbi:hypothetical protein [Actinocorallia populi]|uniref:hypothetical protein n=1 Tax=Actinocorallia populi TaxID=2079200 RepID=UPI000D09469F|nr:hypothetical protein [Actinocorallia populi]
MHFSGFVAIGIGISTLLLMLVVQKLDPKKEDADVTRMFAIFLGGSPIFIGVAQLFVARLGPAIMIWAVAYLLGSVISAIVGYLTGRALLYRYAILIAMFALLCGFAFGVPLLYGRPTGPGQFAWP